MIKGAAVDLDGVIRHWPAEDCAGIEAAHQLDPGSILTTAFRPDLLEPAIRGEVPDEEWRRRIADSLAGRFGPRARPAVAAWSRLRGTVDASAIALVRDLRARAPVVLLTNATTRLRADLAAVGISSLFDQVISSAETGFIKPEPEAYAAVARCLDMPPTDVVVIDDNRGHARAAAALGMVAIHHVATPETRARLNALGALVGEKE